jgi:enoyl-CoA hydratase
MGNIDTEVISKSVRRWTLNRPEKLNAVTRAMYGELADLVNEAEQDEDVKVVILRGAGSSFCSGQDLSEVGFMYGWGTSNDERRPSMRRRLAVDREWSDRLRRLADFSKVSILQVHGHCLGAGTEFLMLGDLAISTPDANIGHPGTRLVGPGLDFGLANWFSLLGIRRAKEMLFTGRTLTGQEAFDLDLVNRLASADEIDDAAVAFAEEVALMPADGVVMGKEAMRMTMEFMGIRSGLLFGATSHTFNTNVRFDPDEFNFFRERRGKGAKQAFHERDERYEQSAPAPASDTPA